MKRVVWFVMAMTLSFMLGCSEEITISAAELQTGIEKGLREGNGEVREDVSFTNPQVLLPLGSEHLQITVDVHVKGRRVGDLTFTPTFWQQSDNIRLSSVTIVAYKLPEEIASYVWKRSHRAIPGTVIYKLNPEQVEDINVLHLGDWQTSEEGLTLIFQRRTGCGC